MGVTFLLVLLFSPHFSIMDSVLQSISREIKKLWVPEEATLPIVIDQRIVPENSIQQALTIISI